MPTYVRQEIHHVEIERHIHYTLWIMQDVRIKLEIQNREFTNSRLIHVIDGFIATEFNDGLVII